MELRGRKPFNAVKREIANGKAEHQAYLWDNEEKAFYFFRNSSGFIPACFSIARNVPSGISPGWLGTVV
jgi:hypothetical protein